MRAARGSLRWLLPAGLAGFWLEERVQACSVCYGAAESPILDGMNFSILFMLVLTYAVAGGFAVFFLYLRKREKLFTGTTRTPLPSGKAEPVQSRR